MQIKTYEEQLRFLLKKLRKIKVSKYIQYVNGSTIMYKIYFRFCRILLLSVESIVKIVMEFMSNGSLDKYLLVNIFCLLALVHIWPVYMGKSCRWSEGYPIPQVNFYRAFI